uniref:YKT6 v-SNARE homolog n=1 Tax=Apteryx owenii TaxID=8824 RepID=A0A8B9QRT9_APTOW
MRLYSLSVLYKGDPKVRLLKAAYDVSTFNFFQRSSIQEFMTFTSQLIVERSELGSRASVKEQEYLCHVYVRNDGLAGVVIADNEYPQRVCFTLLDKVLDEFSRQVSKIDWPSGSPATINYTALDGYLSKYQNPREADPMTRVQAELDETKIILHNTMESLLERGEKLDDLVSKSEVLGAQSKAFYKTVSAALPLRLGLAQDIRGRSPRSLKSRGRVEETLRAMDVGARAGATQQTLSASRFRRGAVGTRCFGAPRPGAPLPKCQLWRSSVLLQLFLPWGRRRRTPIPVAGSGGSWHGREGMVEVHQRRWASELCHEQVLGGPGVFGFFRSHGDWKQAGFLCREDRLCRTGLWTPSVSCAGRSL